ncbi:hypothetical protein F2Q69_00041621 [Brassica cretica]|uniref:Fatty acid desaturase domain-containing protein n=1 Tax=Brassica cretica TaxID=69181 RepID=A0A8S9NBJ0_BRACR|nr:hypothetical protein F2Q69_00041621 [Brassica cretica]
MSRSCLRWLLELLTSTIGLFGLSIGLLKEPCSGLSSFLASILVPYHGWRISHRTHHQNHGHMCEKIYKSLDKPTQFFRFTLSLVMLAYPFYLVKTESKNGALGVFFCHGMEEVL